MRLKWIAAALFGAVLVTASGFVDTQESVAKDGGISLPKVSQVGLEPDAKRCIVIHVNQKGEISLTGMGRTDRGRLSLQELRGHMVKLSADPKHREPDSSSRISVLLDVDEAIPWTSPRSVFSCRCTWGRIRASPRR